MARRRGLRLPWDDVRPETGGANPFHEKCSGLRQASRQGYTLIELSIVLFLIGVFFFISMPKLGNFLFQTDLKDVARSLKSTVQLLRSKSISTHRPTVLCIDLDRNLYWGAYAYPEKDQERAGRNLLLVPAKTLPSGTRFLDAANINTPKKTLGLLTSIFTAKGTMEETVIHMADQSQNVLTIIVNAYTGRFSIFHEYVDVEY